MHRFPSLVPPKADFQRLVPRGLIFGFQVRVSVGSPQGGGEVPKGEV